jgi:hypothetical protein
MLASCCLGGVWIVAFDRSDNAAVLDRRCAGGDLLAAAVKSLTPAGHFRAGIYYSSEALEEHRSIDSTVVVRP